MQLAFALTCASFALAPLASAQTLVRDIDQTPTSFPADSDPAEFTTLTNGDALFVADTATTGRELFVTDGTAPGTTLVADLAPGFEGSEPADLVALPSGLVLFTASTPATGKELWRTDGTPAGTALVKDLHPGSADSSPFGAAVVGNVLFFFADDGSHGIELWRSDGTATGTTLVADVVPGSTGISDGVVGLARLAPLGTTGVVLSALVGGGWELWTSDGTSAGTSSIVGLGAPASLPPEHLTSFGSRVLFQRRDPATFAFERWVTDGTSAGTLYLADSASGGFEVAGPLAFFPGFDATTGEEPWVTDGTPTGTQLVADLAPGVGSARDSHPGFLGALGASVLFFAADDGREWDLFVSDGTAAGTSKLGEVGAPTGGSQAGIGKSLGGFVHFHGSDGVDEGLWRSDGTVAGTTLVSDALSSDLATVGALLVARGEDAFGNEPWTSDGTPAGSQRIVDLAPGPSTEGSFPTVLGTLRDRAVVRVDDGVVGREPWITDGTFAGTTLLADLAPGPDSSYVASIASNDEFLLFGATVAGATKLWRSDGTTAGTASLDLDALHPGFVPDEVRAWGARMLLAASTQAHGFELWLSDGTVAGTNLLVDLRPGTAGSEPRDLQVLGDRAYFVARGSGSGREPYVTDGTAAGTQLLADTVPGLGGILSTPFFAFGDHVYFVAGGGATGAELWRTDGTPAGTAAFLDLEPGPASSEPSDFLVTADRLLFSATVSGVRSLVVGDGTAAGTGVLPTAGPMVAGPWRISDDLALVVLELGPSTYQAWTTDGTLAGTVLFAPISGELPTYLRPSNPTDDRVLLMLDDPVVGRELFVTDGTLAGTRLLHDVSPFDGDPAFVTRIGDRVLFTADDFVHGRELHAFAISEVEDEAFGTFGYGAPGTGGVVPVVGVAGEADASATGPFAVTLSDALGGSAAFFLWSHVPGATPIAGGRLWLGGTVQVDLRTTDASGAASLPVFPSPSLAGARFAAQWFVLDPNGPVLGLASATAGFELVVGP